MPVILSIIPNSPAAKTKIAAGDILLRINGHAIEDVLDYRFYAAERKLKLELRRDNRSYSIKIRKGEYEDLGLEFSDGLMDEQRCCNNNCVFCFIDQLPPGLRAPLYFKDDDARLGFLFGNYITLTNLTSREAQRIIGMRLSPVNVSVHTTNPQLRCKMMGNAQAGTSLRYLAQFAAAGLDLNIQLVLCPGWNDGDELRRSLRDLLRLPTVRSIAAVPVGLTGYRENLTKLRPFTKEEAQEVINAFEEFRCGAAELCASDEFFLIAGQGIPGVDYYGDFRQLENGVGLWASFKEDMHEILTEAQKAPLCQRGGRAQEKKGVSIATGYAAYPLLRFLVDELQKIWHNIHVDVRRIENHFFGGQITVAGLLAGQDIIEQLRGENLGAALLLPAAMFNHDGLTLDGMTAEDISQVLGIPVKAVPNDAQALLDAILSIYIIP